MFPRAAPRNGFIRGLESFMKCCWQSSGSRSVHTAALAGLLALGAGGPTFATGVTNLVVPLPAGETAITAIGLYQVVGSPTAASRS